MIDCRSGASSALGCGTYLTTDLAMPSALQIRRSEYACFARTRAAASRQRTGLSSSLGDFLQDDLIDRQIRHRALESTVLRFELPQPLRLIDPQASVALTPAKVRLLRHPDLLGHLTNRLPLADQHIGLPKLMDDLLSRVSLLRHRPRLLSLF